jgi:hypothetical protein
MKIVYDSGKAHLIPADSDAADDFEGEEFDVPEGALDARPPMIAPLPNTTPMTLAGVMLRKKPVVRSNGDWLRYDTGLNSYVEEEQETFSARVWTGVSETLCMRLSPCSFDGSSVEPFWV